MGLVSFVDAQQAGMCFYSERGPPSLMQATLFSGIFLFISQLFPCFLGERGLINLT